MWKTAGLWLLATGITLGSVVWQRLSGPTHPVSGSVSLGGTDIPVRLQRSHGGDGDQPVELRVTDPQVSGEVAWRRYPTQEPWQVLALKREGEALLAALPHQPPAGKLEFQVRLRRGEESAVFPERPAVTRFKGEVHPALLIPHVILMFLGMLLSVRAGLAALARERARRLCWLTLASLVAGGLVLGPAVQAQAFGEWWTGWPVGHDLTDNKTALAAIAWAVAVALSRRQGKVARAVVMAAALATLVVFAIPHSTWGSELQWSEVPPAGLE